MEQPDRPNEARSSEFQQFALELIDGRHNLVERMKRNATNTSMTLRGYTNDALKLPLSINVPYGRNGIPGGLDFEVSTHDGELAVEKINILPQDSAPIVVKNDEGIIIQESLGDTSLVPASVFKEVLFGLFPENVRYKLTMNNALEVIRQLSPENSAVYEFESANEDFLSNIRVSETETVDDSIFTLEVTKTVIHPSSMLIGTRLLITESIQRQVKKTDITQGSVEIEANDNSSPIFEYAFSEISNSRIVPVTIPTKRHIKDIHDVLNELN